MGSLVNAEFAEWLRSKALYEAAAAPGMAAGLSDAAIESEIISALTTEAGAQAEIARQITVLGQTLAIDRHIIQGHRLDLICRVVELTNDALGYAGGVDCFVIGASERNDRTTELQVLRALS